MRCHGPSIHLYSGFFIVLIDVGCEGFIFYVYRCIQYWSSVIDIHARVLATEYAFREHVCTLLFVNHKRIDLTYQCLRVRFAIGLSYVCV